MKSDAEAAETFARYLRFWMDQENLAHQAVADRAERKGAHISQAKVTSILNGLYANHQMRQLEAVAIAINRPREEVFLAALGYSPPLTEYPEFTQSDIANLWDLMRQLPAKQRKMYEHFVQMLANDIQHAGNKSSE